MNSGTLFFYACVALFLPPTRFFGLKRWLLARAGADVGERVRCVSSARFSLTGRLSIGEDTWVGHDVLIVGGDAPISIGANCDIAPRVTIVNGSHVLETSGNRAAGPGVSAPITIGAGCWVCTGATILGGTDIGQGSVVAAGSVVSGTFPARALIGGIPARVIRDLSDSGTRTSDQATNPSLASNA